MDRNGQKWVEREKNGQKWVKREKMNKMGRIDN
jgi:hypothetical protein